MARVFTGGSSQYLSRSSAFVTAYPLSFFAWVYPTDATAIYRGMTIAATSGVSYLQLALRGDLSGDPVETYVDDGSAPTPTASVSGFTANAWNCVGCVHLNATSHTVYCNGSSATSTTSKAFPTASQFSIARGFYAGTAYYDSATSRWAYAALWNAALDAQECAALAARYHPRMVRPSSLVSSWDLGGFAGENDKDFVGGYDLTATNSPTWADSPGIIWPDDDGDVVTAAGSTAKPWLYSRRGARLIGGGLS